MVLQHHQPRPCVLDDGRHSRAMGGGGVRGLYVNESKGASNFPLASGSCDPLCEQFSLRFSFAAIHQQLAEAFFSKPGTCACKTHFFHFPQIYRRSPYRAVPNVQYLFTVQKSRKVGKLLGPWPLKLTLKKNETCPFPKRECLKGCFEP